MNSPVESVDPEILTALLRHFHWAPSSKEPGRYEIWTADDSPDAQIILPLDPTRRDFSGLLDRACYALFSHYGNPARELLVMLRAQADAALDATQWQKETALPPGMIEWREGENLYAAARQQLAAIARSSRQPRRVHGSASWFLSRSFLDNCFMGQTEVGSFIITAHTPSRMRFHATQHSEGAYVSSPSESEMISGRAIINKLEEALNAVSQALKDYKHSPKMDIFYETVDAGVSYELVKALSKFSQGSESAITIDRSHASSNTSSHVEIAFTPASAPILERVANAFVLDPDPRGVALQGEVVVLSREASREGLARVIRLNVEGTSDIKRVRVRLNAEQYELAMEAHRLEASVRVTGLLQKEGKIWWLYNVPDIEVVERLDAETNTQLNLFSADNE